MKVDFTKGLEKGLDNLHKQGAFLTVKGQDKENTMTISWGSIGFMWQRPVFIAMVRKSRYTFELIEKADSFTVSIPSGSEMKNALITCGTKTGRDINKQEAAGIKFMPAQTVDSPIVEGCNMYYECKIVYKQPMDKALLFPDIQNSMYSDDDYHTLYYGEIVACYEK
jgi:flavin reductase (DIM6/NTAB) family NADH-FMN oxidoreductase RutF